MWKEGTIKKYKKKQTFIIVKSKKILRNLRKLHLPSGQKKYKENIKD